MFVGTMCPIVPIVIIKYSPVCLLCLVVVNHFMQQTVIASLITDHDCDVIRDVMSNGSELADNCTTLAPPSELEQHRADITLNAGPTPTIDNTLGQQTADVTASTVLTSQLSVIYRNVTSTISNTEIKFSNSTNNIERSSPEVDSRDVTDRAHNDVRNTSSLLLVRPEDGVVDDVIGDVAVEPDVMDGKELDNYWNERELESVENNNGTTLTNNGSSNVKSVEFNYAYNSDYLTPTDNDNNNNVELLDVASENGKLRDYHVGAEYHKETECQLTWNSGHY